MESAVAMVGRGKVAIPIASRPMDVALVRSRERDYLGSCERECLSAC